MIDAPVSLTDGTVPAKRPAVAWTGTHFAIAYSILRDGVEQIDMVQLDADGVLSGVARPVTCTGFGASYPTIAWTGDRFGIAWMDGRDTDPEIWFALIE